MVCLILEIAGLEQRITKNKGYSKEHACYLAIAVLSTNFFCYF